MLPSDSIRLFESLLILHLFYNKYRLRCQYVLVSCFFELAIILPLQECALFSLPLQVALRVHTQENEQKEREAP